MSFSAAFQARLRSSAQEANITPEMFLTQFEAYISKPTNGYNGTFYFSLSWDFCKSPTKIECLRALKQNLEACGFKMSPSAYPDKGHFAFTKEDYTCQWDPNSVVCDMSDSSCDKIAIHV
jgi:hypothetical protein